MDTKDQILSALKKQIEGYKSGAYVEKVGHVIEVGDGIARIAGLSDVASQEMIEFQNGQMGVALNLEEDNVGAIILGSDKGIKEGDEVRATGKILSVPAGEAVIGRVVNPLGVPEDGKGEISTDVYYPVEKIAPRVIKRKGVNTPVQTGLKAIDAMIPDGGGSLTALPIVETQAGDVSAYIPTNIISITDGQIFLESDLFYKGIRPALNTGISVSRVGSAAQIKAMKKVAGKLKLELAQYRELAVFAQFGSDLDEATKKQLNKGDRLTEILKQTQYSALPVEKQVVILYAGINDYLSHIPVTKVKDYEEKLHSYFDARHSDILKEIKTTKDLPAELEEKLKKALHGFNSEHKFE